MFPSSIPSLQLSLRSLFWLGHESPNVPTKAYKLKHWSPASRTILGSFGHISGGCFLSWVSSVFSSLPLPPCLRKCFRVFMMCDTRFHRVLSIMVDWDLRTASETNAFSLELCSRVFVPTSKVWLRQLLMLFSRWLCVLSFLRGSLFRLLFLLLFCPLLLYMCVRCVCACACAHVRARTHIWRSAALESQSSPSSFMRSLGIKLRLPDLHSKSPLTTQHLADLPSWFWERISHLPRAVQSGWMASTLFISAFPAQGLHSSAIHSHHDKQSSQRPKVT